MKFAHPVWFWAFALLPLLIALWVRGEVRRRKILGRLIAARLQPVLAGGVSLLKRRLRFALLLAGLACVFLALTQPRYGYRLEQRKSVGRDVLIAIDVSRSMLANDLSPSRLARAKLAAEDLIGQLHGDRVGLIAFAGSTFLQAPLTIDYAAVRESLREMDTRTIPLGGTNIAEAIRSAVDAFGKGESDQRALILITDGEELDEDGVAEARKAAEAVRIFTVGVGSPEGTIIALPGAGGQTEYVKTPEGQIVKSALDETRLRAIAEAANGFYVHLESGPAEMETIARQGLDAMNTHEAETEITQRPIERYRWPLAAGLVLLGASLLPGERRRSAAAAAGLALLCLATPALAKNSGVEAYERQDFSGALDSFERQLQKSPDSASLQFDAGTAAYKAGDLDKALDSFSRALTLADPALREKTEYNLGNTLFERGAVQKEAPAKMKDWKNSVQHFGQALKTDPRDANAKYNRDLVQRMIEELQKEEEQKKQDQEKKDDQDKKDQKKQDPQKGGGEGKQDQQSKGGGQVQQQGQSGQSKEGQEQKSEKSEGKEGKAQEGKEEKDGKDGKEGPDQQPQPAPGQEERKLTGKISDAPQRQEGKSEKDEAKEAEQQAAEEAAAAAEGKMTPAQAAALLDSLKSTDKRVRLLSPNAERRDDRPVRDW